MAGIPTEILALRQHQADRRPAEPRSARSVRSTPGPDPRRQCGRSPLEAQPTRGYPAAAAQAERLGEWLVRRRCIGRCDLFSALDVAFRHGCRLGDALVWLELLDRQTVEREARFFARLACSAPARVVPPAE